MTSVDRDSRFYDVLKNAQPLAFLASVSIGIAVLIHAAMPTMEQEETIYNYAISAGSYFLFSFIVSLVYQLIEFPERTKQFLRWTRNFLLVIGILFLLLIVFTFSIKIPQILSVPMGWIFLAMGIYMIIDAKKEWKSMKKDKFRVGMVIFLFLTVFFMCAIFWVTPFLPHHTSTITNSTLHESVSMNNTIFIKH